MKTLASKVLLTGMTAFALSGCDGMLDTFFEDDNTEPTTTTTNKTEDEDSVSSETYPTGGDGTACFNLSLQQTGTFDITRQLQTADMAQASTSLQTMTVETGVTFNRYTGLIKRTIVDSSGETKIEYNRIEQDALLGVAVRNYSPSGVLSGEFSYMPFQPYTLFGLNSGESHTAVYEETSSSGVMVSEQKTYTYIGEETITIEGKSIETCRFQINSTGVQQDQWVAKSFGEQVKLITNPGTTEESVEQITAIRQGSTTIF